MQIIKKTIAFIMSLTLVMGLAGCANTRYVLTVDGEEIAAGIYLYYALNAFTAAVDVIDNQDKTFDPTKKADVEKAIFNGMPLEQYVQEEATLAVAKHVASVREFKRLGLTLDDERKKDANEYMKYFWDEFEKNLEENGIGKESMTEIINTMYYNEAMFDYYYKEGGEKGITDEDLRTFYLDNYARVKYLSMPFTNAAGEALIGDAKQDVIDQANEYKEEIQAGTEFEAVKSEYESVSSSQSVSYSSSSASVSESQSLADAATGTDENGNTTTPASTTSATTTTTSGTAGTTTETVTVAEPDTTETTTGGTTDADGSTASATTTVTAQTTTDTTTTSVTTTTEKYPNEIIFTKVTTEEPTEYDVVIEGGVTTTTAAPNYYPNQEVHDAIFSQTEYNKPFTVETASAIYLIVRYDLSERMTTDDLWTEELIEGDDLGNNGLRVTAYQKEFLDSLEELSKTYKIERNDSSFKRYTLWKFEIDETV